MKSLYTFSTTFLSLFFLSLSIFAQQIDSIQVTPSYTPLPTDTVKVYIHQTFNSGGCAGSANFTKSSFNIGSSSLHCLGALAVICHDIDTLIIPPPHTVGTYRIIHVLSTGFGGPPCSPGIVPSDIDTAYYTVGPVTPPDNPPMITPLPGDSMCDTSTYMRNFNIADEDVANVTVTAYSDNQLVVSDANISLGGSGANRNITVTPTPGSPGLANIYVVAEDVKNQKDSVSFPIFTVDCDSGTTGIKEPVSLDFHVYPNPASTQLIMEYLSLDRKISKVFLTDASGKKHTPPLTHSAKRMTLDISSLPKGVYVLTIIDTDHIGWREKIVIDR